MFAATPAAREWRPPRAAPSAGGGLGGGGMWMLYGATFLTGGRTRSALLDDLADPAFAGLGVPGAGRGRADRVAAARGLRECSPRRGPGAALNVAARLSQPGPTLERWPPRLVDAVSFTVAGDIA
ncbi:hypothetical protein [Plantactinospora sp. CA-290183]|uniref:hypothetical protein n=1 Tax=Plantactinospora sp. CA-290183 TaxID=3240006 RepID=UPI003D8CA180